MMPTTSTIISPHGVNSSTISHEGVTYLLLVVMASLYSTIVMATLTLVPVQYVVDDDRQTLDGDV